MKIFLLRLQVATEKEDDDGGTSTRRSSERTSDDHECVKIFIYYYGLDGLLGCEEGGGGWMDVEEVAIQRLWEFSIFF